MKTKLICWLVPCILLIIPGNTLKKDLSPANLTKEKVIIIGTIEYNYSALKNKRIKGIDIFIDSQSDAKNFRLPNKYLPKEENKYFSFINKIGNYGEYQLVYQQNKVSGEIDNLVSLMEMDRNSSSNKKIPLQKYTINDCKIINIGRIVVNYKGGEIIDGNIHYTYTFNSVENDTTALHAFRETYPEICNNPENSICLFEGESLK